MSKKQKTVKLTVPCGCGKDHLVTNKKKFVTFAGKLWHLECLVGSMSNELTNMASQLTFYKMMIKKIESDYKNIDMKEVAKQVIDDIANLEKNSNNKEEIKEETKRG